MQVNIRQTPLRHTSRGYIRQLGKLGKGQAKFYLGHDPRIALDRREHIEAIYSYQCRINDSAHWSDLFLDFARQIEKHGNVVYKVPEPFYFNGAKQDFSFIDHLRQLGIPIFLEGNIDDASAKVTLAPATTSDNQPVRYKLHQALTEYSANRCKTYIGAHAGQQRVKKQIEKFFAMEDVYVGHLTYTQIVEHVDYWRARPVTKHGKPCSKSYAENQIGEFYKFLNWLDATSDEFTLPNLDSIDRSVKKIESDVKSNAIAEYFWKPEEIKEVYKTAQPLTKLIIGLGLNTCSGAAELGRLKVDDFLFDCEHPNSDVLGFAGKHNWMITTRRKAFTHSEALLWDWVADLVRDQIAICKKNKWQYLFTENGEPLYRHDDVYREVGLPEPKTTKPESRFAGRFGNAVDFAISENRIDRKLSLGKFRKTFANFLTMKKHGDLGSLALSHSTDTDKLLKHYANKPYGRLFAATLEYKDIWQL